MVYRPHQHTRYSYIFIARAHGNFADWYREGANASLSRNSLILTRIAMRQIKNLSFAFGLSRRRYGFFAILSLGAHLNICIIVIFSFFFLEIYN